MEANSQEEESLDAIAAALRAQFERSNAAREQALKICREVIQLSSRSIRAIHRGEQENARELLREAKQRVDAAIAVLSKHPDLFHAGYVHDSQKEYVEAEAMLAIVTGAPLPAPDFLGVEAPAYLNGIAEAASESRRYVLDRLRLEDMGQAEAILKRMDDIYYALVTFDFPDAITGGLRRTTDALRAVLERTRADLTLTLSQKRLQDVLEHTHAELRINQKDLHKLIRAELSMNQDRLYHVLQHTLKARALQTPPPDETPTDSL